MGFRTERKKAGKKVSEVMQLLGVSDAAVYCWETGKSMPTADKLVKLAKFYGCPPDALFEPDEPR